MLQEPHTPLGGLLNHQGLSWAHSPRLVFDAAVSVGLDDDAVDWIAQVGFTSLLFRLPGYAR